jgi:hypothetical protein
MDRKRQKEQLIGHPRCPGFGRQQGVPRQQLLHGTLHLDMFSCLERMLLMRTAQASNLEASQGKGPAAAALAGAASQKHHPRLRLCL